MTNKNITLNDVMDTLNEEQRIIIYCLIGYALETGRDYICGSGDFDNSKQREFRETYNSLDEVQKRTVSYLIKEAIKEYREERKKKKK